MATDMTQGEENSNKFLINRGESVETGLPFREMETSLPGTYSNLQVGLGGAAAVGKLVETFSPSIKKIFSSPSVEARRHLTITAMFLTGRQSRRVSRHGQVSAPSWAALTPGFNLFNQCENSSGFNAAAFL
ncbi:hypothetical protein RRG08_046703 [Elysia crispata]|uniref:Uncharacterized protein n=1 Tax=Elysia crispata TaxID=231223 RepID=A0AAE1DWC9_9GAST|nr:hypothetical protein RRG08_046703 [Elysia crispata]